MRKMLVFKIKRNFFVERIENPVNTENIIEFNILKDFLSNKTDEEVKTLYINEIYLGLKSIEIAVNSSIFENDSLIAIEIYEKNLIQLIEAFEAESIKDETYKYIIKDMFDMYECGEYEEISFESILKPSKSLEIKNGKIIKNDFYHLNSIDLTIRFNNNKTNDYYASYKRFSLMSGDDRNTRWHDFYRDLFAVVKYDLKWDYDKFNLIAYENTKSNDEILWEDIQFDNLDDEYDIFL